MFSLGDELFNLVIVGSDADSLFTLTAHTSGSGLTRSQTDKRQGRRHTHNVCFLYVDLRFSPQVTHVFNLGIVGSDADPLFTLWVNLTLAVCKKRNRSHTHTTKTRSQTDKRQGRRHAHSVCSLCVDLISCAQVTHVFNLGIVGSDADYVHRAGRVGRIGQRQRGAVLSVLLPSEVDIYVCISLCIYIYVCVYVHV